MKTESIKTFAGSFKGMFTRVVMAGTLAGAVFVATAKPAAAQGFSVQFGVGHPYARPYYGPVDAPPVYGPGFYAERRHEEWLRHERWQREHDGRFHGRPSSLRLLRALNFRTETKADARFASAFLLDQARGW